MSFSSIALLLSLLGWGTPGAHGTPPSISGGDYSVEWFVIDSGGAPASGGGYEAHSSVGGPAGSSNASSYEVIGGFFAPQAGSNNATIFRDGFESGDLGNWSTVVGGLGASPDRLSSR